jgi:hypothetical protein
MGVEVEVDADDGAVRAGLLERTRWRWWSAIAQRVLVTFFENLGIN